MDRSKYQSFEHILDMVHGMEGPAVFVYEILGRSAWVG